MGLTATAKRCLPPIKRATRRARERILRRRLRLSSVGPLSFSGDFSAAAEARELHAAFSSASRNPSHLPAHIREMEGMSGQRYRSFINLLVGNTADARYLEIGCWKGSTVCAALHGNSATATCIDNWSEFGGPHDEFMHNTAEISTRLNVIEQDFRAVDYGTLGTFNVYLFDGPHSQTDHCDGITMPRQACARRFIMIVDDWNWLDVRLGTLRGIDRARHQIEAAIEVRTTLDDTYPKIARKHSDWHNGYFIAAIKATAAITAATVMAQIAPTV